jgi:hypothetical protein
MLQVAGPNEVDPAGVRPEGGRHPRHAQFVHPRVAIEATGSALRAGDGIARTASRRRMSALARRKPRRVRLSVTATLETRSRLELVELIAAMSSGLGVPIRRP